MPKGNQRGIVQHSFNDPVDITESGRLRDLSNAQEELIFYATKVSGPCICGMVLFLSVSISLSMTAMGCLYFHECPAQDNIPIYLIVGGSMYLIYVVGRYATTTTTKGYFTILSIFLCAWLITGSVWIFSIYEPSYDPSDDEKYCNKNLYLFSFWITIAEYIMCVILVIYLCALCYLAIPVE